MAAPNTINTPVTTLSDAVYPDEVLPSLVELFDPPSHSMCEFGDIMLVIEDGYHPQLKLRVNSCILSSTSKVFRALLRGCFAEGAAIRSGETREVYMNDHPTSMLALCQLLHHKPVEPAIDERGMLPFALLVDKFDCVEALKPATDSILSQLGGSRFYDLTVSAFILDQPKHFRSFSKRLVLCSQELYPAEMGLGAEYPQAVQDHLPAGFMTHLTHQQSTVRKELVHCLTSMIDRYATASSSMARPHLVHDLMDTMRCRGLWPIWPTGEGTMCLQDQLAAFSSIDLLNTSMDTMPGYMAPARDLTSRTIVRLSEIIGDLGVGLCLNCIRGDGEGCGLAHPEPWSAYQAERKALFELREQSVSVRSRSPMSVDVWGRFGGDVAEDLGHVGFRPHSPNGWGT